MNFITFSDSDTFNVAVNALALESAPEYEMDNENLSIFSTDIYAIVELLHNNSVEDFEVVRNDDEPRDDMDGDFDSGMASAGFGTDEDYGYFGGDE